MDIPKYDINDIVYLRESAALGFLEAVRINGLTKRDNDWVYSIYAGTVGAANANLYGDRRSLINGSLLYFTENEFVTEYEAMVLTKANLERQLDSIDRQIQSKYPNGDV